MMLFFSPACGAGGFLTLSGSAFDLLLEGEERFEPGSVFYGFALQAEPDLYCELHCCSVFFCWFHLCRFRGVIVCLKG